MPSSRSPNKNTPILKQKPAVYLAATLALLVLAGSVLAGWHYYSRSANLPCTENAGGILEEAKRLYELEDRGIISPAEQEDLSRLAAKIKQQPNHEHDINCQYILANHHLHGNLVQAENRLANVKALAADGQTVSGELPEAGIERLELEVEIYKGARKDVINNTTPIPITEEDLE